MKTGKYLLALMFCFSLAPLAAQKYMVANAGAGTEYYSGGEWKPLARRDMLGADSRIRLGENTSLTFIDVQSEDVYSYGQPGETTVAKAVKKGKTSVVKRFAQHLAASIRTGDADKTGHKATVVYRDANADGAIYAALKDPAFRSGYLLGLELIDPLSLQPLGRELALGRKFVFRVTNHSGEALFVNVLGIDANGEMFDCLPADDAMTMVHLLVPAHGTVDFTEFPLELSYPAGEQRFILFASVGAFDLRRVIELAARNEPAFTPQSPVGKFNTGVTLR